MKILLFGKNGQVGWELQRSLAFLGELIALDLDDTTPLSGNLLDLDGIRATIRTVQPDVIVNAAAYTAVDKAEQEPEVAKIINAEAPAVMAEEAATLGAFLLHYSTDYVFDGSGTNHLLETDLISPLNVYGQTKADGDRAIAESGCGHIIFRVSWVYSTHGSNFIHTMLKLMQQRETLSIVSDQVGVPVGADLIADISAHALYTYQDRPECRGIYNLAPSGETNWYEFAQLIASQADKNGISLKIKNIEPISTKEYPTPAERPLNSRLNTNKLCKAFGLQLPDWQTGITRVIQEIAKGRQTV